jgi:hypothetical protein
VISGNQLAGITIQKFNSALGAANNVVQGNFIGTDPLGAVAIANVGPGVNIQDSSAGNLIGGATATARNVISGNNGAGIQINNSNGNTVQNNFIGTDKNGVAAVGNSAAGIWITNTTLNTLVSGNLISGNAVGVTIDAGAAFNVLKGNLIGADVTGTLDLGNTGNGVQIMTSASLNTIGGTLPGDRNIISGNNGCGVQINTNSPDGNTVLGNYIGADITGTVGLGNSGDGVLINGGVNHQIGGIATSAANVIAFNAGNGVTVDGSGTVNNVIRGNSIFANGGLGIDLTNGGNNSQSFPNLTGALPGASSRVGGTFNAAADTTFTLDFYANSTSDGEGRRYLGTYSVTSDGAGLAKFEVALASATTAGEYITVTATDPAGNTSEFSAVQLVVNRAPTIASTASGSNNYFEASELDFSATMSDQDPLEVFTITWTVTKDGSPFTTHTETKNANPFATGATDNFSFTPDDNATYVVTSAVTDSLGLTATDSRTFTVGNVSSSLANISVVPGTDENGNPLPVTCDAQGRVLAVRGQAMIFKLTAADVSPVDQLSPFTFTVNWGDGTIEDLHVPSGTHVAHIYRREGAFPIELVAVSDKDGGGVGSTSQLTVNDPNNPADDSVFTQKVAVVSGGYTLLVGAATTGSNIVLSQDLATQIYATSTSKISQGTLALVVEEPSHGGGPFATHTITVTIDATNDTLQGLADAINAAASVVTAITAIAAPSGSGVRLTIVHAMPQARITVINDLTDSAAGAVKPSFDAGMIHVVLKDYAAPTFSSKFPFTAAGVAATAATRLNDLDTNTSDYAAGDYLHISGRTGQYADVNVNFAVTPNTTLGETSWPRSRGTTPARPPSWMVLATW